MATTISTIKNADKTDNLLPRTQIKAIFDKNGDYLDDDLTASDLNPLKDGALDKVPICEDGVPGTPIPIDADTLEGHDASYFATADALSSLSGTVTDMKWTKVWTNNATTTNYPQTVLDIDLTGYNYAMVIWKELTTSNNRFSSIVPLDGGYYICSSLRWTGSYGVPYMRSVQKQSNGLFISTGYYLGTNYATTADNSVCLPLEVWVCK